MEIMEQEPQVEEKQFRQHPLITIAQRIANGEAGQFVYCLEDGNFYLYEDGFWKEIHAIVFMEKICNNLLIRGNKILNRLDVNDREKIVKNFKVQKYKHLEDFNKLDLLNFKQGMFDPKGNNVLIHNPDYLSTLRIPYKYDMLAQCPLWINTLEGIFEGDKNKIDVLQEYMGYCLTRDVTREKALLLIGESRSGKSTILETINHLLGGENNVSSVALENLDDPQYTSMLINKMVNIDWDVASNAQKFETKFKIITSGEPVGVNQKYIKAFTFRPYCKLIMAANRFPRITDHSSAFYKRLIILPCDRVFEPHEQNLKLKHTLPTELSGIFNWAVKGLQRLENRGGFEVHKEFMTDAISELREESNPVELFFQEFIIPDVSGPYSIEKNDLYKKYVDWCQSNGNGALSAMKFGISVYQKYSKFTPKKAQSSTTGKRIWRNLKYIEFKTDKQQDAGWQDDKT